MTPGALLLFALVLGVAFANGANDVSKGIATLVGSGVTRIRTAVVWGTIWTELGAFTAAVAAQGLVKAFSGNGLIASMPPGNGFLGAVAFGAVVWVWFATRTGLPVSTTHALTGALVGAGMVAGGSSGVKWSLLSQKFLLPLALSPFLSLLCLLAVAPLLSATLRRLSSFCLCQRGGEWTISRTGGVVSIAPIASELVAGRTVDCAADTACTVQLNLADALHWGSSGAVSFARGLNDAPKILGIGLVASVVLGLDTSFAFFLVAMSMGAGSVLAGFRVTETLAGKVTRMTPGEGFTANLVTAALVIAASWFSLPVSTTHVSTGAIVGLGLRHDARAVQWRNVGQMLLAWIVTLPVAGLLAAAACWVALR
ncbi:MAG: inorganic phosphate transporter [Verrucomicrobia bacterium]|nr:inorganic phosphate transporter [Verrucomicrobiota bacterium]